LLKGKRVEVTTYAGYRGEEQPRAFIIGSSAIDIIKIEGRWIEQDADGGNRRRCFRIQGTDGHMYLLCCHELTSDWYLE